MLFVGGMDAAFSEMPFKNALKELDKKIVECKFEGGKWVFMRVRTDKSYPNAYSTAMGKLIIVSLTIKFYALLDFSRLQLY